MSSIDRIDAGRRKAEMWVIMGDLHTVEKQRAVAWERATPCTSRRAKEHRLEADAFDLEVAALYNTLLAACALAIEAKDEAAQVATGKQFELLVNALEPNDPAIGWLVTHNGTPLAYACYTKAEVTPRPLSPGDPWYMYRNEKWYSHSPILGVMTLAQHAGDPAYEVKEDSDWGDEGAISRFGSSQGILSHFRDEAKARPGWGKYLIDPFEWAAAEHCGDTPPDGYCGCHGDMSPSFQELQYKLLRKRVRPDRMMAALVAHRLGKSKWGEELKQPLANHFRECPADYFHQPANEPLLVVEWKLKDNQVATWHMPQCGGWGPESSW